MQNIHNLERVIRIAAATFVAYRIWYGRFIGLSGYEVIGLGTMAIYLLMTATMGYCPLYSMLRIATKKKY